MLLRTVFVAILICISGAVLRAGTPAPLVIDDKPFFTEIGSHAAFLQDAAGELSIDEVMSAEWSSRFAADGRRIPSFGFTRAAIWVRFTIESTGGRDQSVILELSMSRMNHFEWFVVEEGTVEQSLACGIEDPGGGLHPRLRFPAVSFIVPAGETRTVYARAKSDASMWLPLVMGSPMEFDHFATHRNFWDFAQVGFCAALSLLSLGLWLFGGRSRLYLSVAFAMAFGLLQVMIFNGLYAWFGGPWVVWVSYQGLPVCVMLFAMAFARFAQDYLGWENLRPLERHALRSTYLLSGAAALAAAFVPFAVSAAFVLPLEILALTVPAAVSASVALRRRGRGMSLFLIAWLVLLLMVVLLVFQFFGAIPVLLAPSTALRIALPSIFFLFILSGATAQRAVLQMQARVAALQSAETDARLEALRYQMNPHFLFNTLTSIEELSHEAPSRIPRLVGRLAEFLRLRLEPESSHEITLERELESVRAYLDIEQVRFEERLKVDYDIPPAAGSCLVPEMILMPLVENAVKYGFEDSELLRIRIAARMHEGTLALKVENNGRLRSDRRRSRGGGVGTKNLSARLKLRYGDAASLSLAQKDDLVIAEVKIPATKSGQ